MNKPDTRTIFALVTKPLVEELRTQDFAGSLTYAAMCVRRCAKQMHGEDQGETKVLRSNMRVHAQRLERVARSLRNRADDR